LWKALSRPAVWLHGIGNVVVTETNIGLSGYVYRNVVAIPLTSNKIAVITTIPKATSSIE
jgi:hypothetical protein